MGKIVCCAVVECVSFPLMAVLVCLCVESSTRNCNQKLNLCLIANRTPTPPSSPSPSSHLTQRRNCSQPILITLCVCVCVCVYVCCSPHFAECFPFVSAHTYSTIFLLIYLSINIMQSVYGIGHSTLHSIRRFVHHKSECV